MSADVISQRFFLASGHEGEISSFLTCKCNATVIYANAGASLLLTDDPFNMLVSTASPFSSVL